MAGLPFQSLRYGSDGVLGQAAALAGSVPAYNQQKQMDMQFINNEYDRRQRMSEFAMNNQLESQKLQMAGQLAMQQRGATATSGIAGAKQSPFTQAIINAKQLAIQNASEHLTPEEQAGFSADALDPSTNALDFSNAVQKRVVEHQNTSAKAKAVEAQKGNIDPEDLPAISEMVANSQYSPSQVMQAMHQSGLKREQKGKQAQDKAAKDQVWNSVLNDKTMTPEDHAALGPLMGSPEVNATQLQAKAAQLRASHGREGKAAIGQKLATGRAVIADLRSRAREAMAARADLFNAGVDLSTATPADRAFREQVLGWVAQADSIRDQLAQHLTQTATDPVTKHRLGVTEEGEVVDAETFEPMGPR